MKTNELKKERGITLIALVITIIVLLILAGVAVSMLSGENGILGRATDAKTKTEQATIDEKVKMAVVSAKTEGYGKIESESAYKALNEGLKEAGYIAEEDITSLPKTITIDENKYIIRKDGEIVKVGEPEEIGKIANAENYGDLIKGYYAGGERNWRIFYNDGNNVWITPTSYAILNKEIAENLGVDVNIAVNRGYVTWSRDASGNFKKGIECAKDLANTDNWKYYVDEKYAIKAMGGPTIEMFANSYNQKYPNGEKGIIEYTGDDTNGYTLKWSKDKDYNNYAIIRFRRGHSL